MEHAFASPEKKESTETAEPPQVKKESSAKGQKRCACTALGAEMERDPPGGGAGAVMPVLHLAEGAQDDAHDEKVSEALKTVGQAGKPPRAKRAAHVLERGDSVHNLPTFAREASQVLGVLAQVPPADEAEAMLAVGECVPVRAPAKRKLVMQDCMQDLELPPITDVAFEELMSQADEDTIEKLDMHTRMAEF